MKKILIGLCAAVTLAGCATADSNAPATEREEAVYRTGSNIPSRQRAGDADGVKSYDREALDRAGYEPPPMQRPMIPGSKPGG